jgi:hypothetical protein
MNPVLKKLFYKGRDPVLLLKAPAEFAKTARDFGGKVHTTPRGRYPFVLAFVKSLAEGEKLAKGLPKVLEEGTVLWVAYPKETSPKYKSDYNRDSGRALMGKRGLDGVSLVSLDEDWSAMRFKRPARAPETGDRGKTGRKR